MLGLIRRVLSSTAILAIAGCPGDPTEANSGLSNVSADDTGGTDASNTVSADDDSTISESISDTSGDDTTDPTDTDTGDDLCGNGMVEPPETCDLGPNNTMGTTCTNECRDNICDDGYVGYGESCEPPGSEGCGDDCILTSCGDGMVDASVGEDCDPPMAGTCSPLCEFPGCGDGFIDPALGEECEGNNLDNETCVSLGYFAGDLQCDGACHFVRSSCTNCGNGSVEEGEDCDPSIGAETCVTQGFDEGDLSCAVSCLFDTSQCVTAVCGNNEAEGMEICDGDDLNGHTCQTELFAPGGTILCNACQLDTSGCSLCGNGVVNPDETCEMGVPFPMMCSMIPPFDNGSMVLCDFGTCELDTSMCCGDDTTDPCVDDEDCCGMDIDCGKDGTCCLDEDTPCGGNDSLCCSGDCNNGTNTCT